MKILIFIIAFLALFGGLMAFFNFTGIYTVLTMVGEYINMGVQAIIYFVGKIMALLQEYSLVFLLVALFVALWVFEVFLVHVLGGKKE